MLIFSTHGDPKYFFPNIIFASLFLNKIFRWFPFGLCLQFRLLKTADKVIITPVISTPSPLPTLHSNCIKLPLSGGRGWILLLEIQLKCVCDMLLSQLQLVVTLQMNDGPSYSVLSSPAELL